MERNFLVIDTLLHRSSKNALVFLDLRPRVWHVCCREHSNSSILYVVNYKKVA